MNKRIALIAVAVFSTVLATSGSFASEAAAPGSDEVKKIHDSEDVLKAAVTAPDKGIPKDLLERAECIGVFPGLAKGAFIVGGEFGRGVFTCRRKDGSMGAPAFFSIGGGSVGWQIGGEQADVVLLVMNEGGVKRLLQDKFTLGGEAAAVAGPVGRNAQAATDAQLHAEILSWSRSRGLFLGASLKGMVIKQSKKATEDLYGRPLTAQQILVAQTVTPPESARSFVRTATEYSRRSS
ncbi:MAG TPA: lipid-binding SYLF domain-containing protein [Patescibacteria group bacterium]|nr:lipid-binding SYLF domain-containing protein [Patescibacteria group bacterium]